MGGRRAGAGRDMMRWCVYVYCLEIDEAPNQYVIFLSALRNHFGELPVSIVLVCIVLPVLLSVLLLGLRA